MPQICHSLLPPRFYCETSLFLRFSVFFRNHFLGHMRIFFQKFQYGDLLQSAIFVLWSCTWDLSPAHPENMTKTVFEFILSVKQQIFKESLKKNRGCGNSLGIIIVICPQQGVPKIPRMLPERLVAARGWVHCFPRLTDLTDRTVQTDDLAKRRYITR